MTESLTLAFHIIHCLYNGNKVLKEFASHVLIDGLFLRQNKADF